VLFQQKGALPDTAYHSVKSFTEYRLKPMDILEIKNLQNSKNIVDLNPAINTGATQATNTNQVESFQVENDGTIALTGLGHVVVAGLTRIEAQNQIEALYHKLLLKDPIIQLKIINLKVILFGEVKTQGSLPLTKDQTSLVEMIGSAGGLTENANANDVKIIRGSEKNPQVTTVDLSDIQSINDPKAMLQNGDIIYVSKNKRATRNDNLQNFSTIFQPILLLFNTALIVFTLVRH
jgi:polysaccharide export outer membrane protein